MPLKKSSLALAVAAALAAGNAYAAVTLQTNGTAVKFAREINTASAVDLTNASNVLDLTAKVNFGMSANEVRHARIECSPNLTFKTASVTASSSFSVGSVNGIGTSAISFPITAGSTPTTIATDTFTVAGDRTINSTGNNVSCTYALYDQPSQASNGGATGRIDASMITGPYVDFVQSMTLTVPTANTNTATVEALPQPFNKFKSDSISTTQAAIGNFKLALTSNVYKIDGTTITMSDLLGSGSKLLFGGDFSAKGSVEYGESSCGSELTALTNITNTSAEIVGNAELDEYLCYTVSGSAVIPESDYTVSLQAVAASSAYVVSNQGPINLGKIIHDGTELQAPVVQYPAGFSGRIFLSNKGTTDAPYKTQFLPDVGTTAGPPGAKAEGVVPAGKHILVDVSQIFTVTAGPPRGSLIIYVSGANSAIQGAYQLYNSNQGTLTNMGLMRPGGSN